MYVRPLQNIANETDAAIQLDITDDGFLSLMSDDGSTKDDVKLPDNEIGEKITKLYTEEGKDTSELRPSPGII